MTTRRATFAFLALAGACAAPAPAADDPPPDLALQGTRWVMAFEDRAAGARAPTLEFAAEGRASGFAGCNQWFAQVRRDNSGVRFEAVGMTRRACAEPAMSIERDFAERLARTRSAQRDGEDLVLYGDQAEQVARFSPIE